MLRVVTLLNQKNHYLEKFYSLNETEYINFSRGNFDNLDDFYQMRDKILEIIQYIDRELEVAQNNLSGELTSEVRFRIKESLAIKDEYVNRILGQDLEILACIETAKSNIIKELQVISKAKKTMSKYKSGQSDARRIDEEA